MSMTTQEANARLREVESLAEDDELAHAAEDRFRREVLKVIANGQTKNIRTLARIALRTYDIRFSRWYA